MSNVEVYTLNTLTGQQELSSVVSMPDPVNDSSGEVTLVPTAGGSIAKVYSSYASQNSLPMLTRVGDTNTSIGQIYVRKSTIVDGVSFEIKSTNASDTGRIYWEF